VRKALAAIAALLFTTVAVTAQPARTDRAAIANGESAYLRIGCHACHGTVGHGGAAPRLAPNPLPLEGFTTWVRNGTPGWSFLSGMPAYPAAILPDDDLANIRAYLASVPAPPPADELPLLAR
jgi:mono/diheme cytochrome c family protein